MKMTSTSAESEDGDYIKKGSFTCSSRSRNDDALSDNNDQVRIQTGENTYNNGLKKLNSQIKRRDEYSLMEKINYSDRIDNEEIEDDLSDQNDISVNLIVGHDSINLRLNEEMEVQEVIDIVGDMFGLIENHLGLEMNEELVETNTKLKLLAEHKSVEMKVVVCIDDEVTSIVIDNLDHTDFVETNLKQCQNISVQTNSRTQLCSRETQTPKLPLVDSATNTPHTKSVQADASVGPKDTILQIKEYVPYDDLVKYHNAQAVMIQKCIRRFLAQKRIIKMKKERDLALLKKKLQNEEFCYEKLQDSIKEIMNKRPVLLHDDFSKAYALLMKWLEEEKMKIIRGKSGKDKKVALSNLFKKEMECLRYIQKCRMETKNENEQKLKFRILDEASQPPLKLTIQGNNSTNENENVFKASLFKNFYRDLKRRDQEINERIICLKDLNDFLFSLNAPECTQEMVALIEREIQMISLGVKKSSLEGLRKRLEEMFLYLSTDPEFNPALSKQRKATESETLFRCKTCKELKPSKKFNIDLLKGLTHCTVCTLRKELAHSSVSLAPYKYMIQEIYKDEMKKGSHEGYISLLQPSGLYYLVQRIWQGRSCLSEENDLDLLRFIRWNKNYPWSPWNCILLTENEAELHLSIEGIHSFYGEHFIKKIENKHLQAKTKFTDLEELNDRIKTCCSRIIPVSKSITIQEPLSAHSIINPKTKKLEPNCILKEPISDLVFARCNVF